MPELPEVESVVRSLRPHAVGERIARVWTSGKRLRHRLDQRALSRDLVGRRITGLERRGKYILAELDRGQPLVVHLGMTGRWVWIDQGADDAPPVHTHVRLWMAAGGELRFSDPRRFGYFRVGEVTQKLGLDPFARAFTAEWLGAALRRSRRDLKAFLMDQKHLAGLGNIYVSEALYLAWLHPQRRCDSVDDAGAQRLHAAIKKVLRSAIRRRGTTFLDYVDANGEPGENQGFLNVYGKVGEPCPSGCGRKLLRIEQGGRSTFFCNRCQPRARSF